MGSCSTVVSMPRLLLLLLSLASYIVLAQTSPGHATAGQQPRPAPQLPAEAAQPGSRKYQHQQKQQESHLQQQRRQLLAAKKPEASAEAAKDATGPFANLTVGNVTAERENALRKALLDGYENGNFPWAEYGAAQVKLNVALHKILDVDLHGGTLKLAVWLRQEWQDPRLTWDAKEWNVSKMWFLNPQQGDTELWQPDIALWNAANPILYTLSQNPLMVTSAGRVNWGRPGVFEVSCNFKGLSAYPFGRVRCELELGSWSYGPWYVNVTVKGKGYDVGGSVTSGESAVWTEYRIQNVEARRHTYPAYPCCPDESDWPVVVIAMSLERQNLIYMMKVIVPQIILTAIAFSTFWLSPACGERLGLAVTVPLAVAVYDLLTFSQLPISNKVTLVSAMGMAAFLFSMAVLLENAFVIQLWHYAEHSYFKGVSVLLATGVAYREQLVWVHLLGCIHQLKTEVARRQLALLQGGARSTTPKTPRGNRSFGGLASLKRWHDLVAMQQGSSKNMAGHASPLNGSSEPSLRGSKDVAAGPPGGCSPEESGNGAAPCPAAGAATHLQDPAGAEQSEPVTGPPGSLSAPGGSAEAPAGARPPAGELPGWQVLGRHLSLQQPVQQPGLATAPSADSNVALKLDELETQMGQGREHGAGDVGADSLLLSCTSKEQLRAHLLNILTSSDKGLAVMQRRIQKAFVVFGEDGVVSRLHAVLAGAPADASKQQPLSTAGGAPAAAGAGAGTGPVADAATHSLHNRLSGEFNRRWQLLSTMIDHVCRYLFILAYVVSMVSIIVVLTNSDDT